MRASILIATRNRCRRLALSLESYRRLCIPAALQSLEVVVIDNGSSDDTPAVVADASRTSPFPIRYLSDPRPGKSLALNTGIREANGDLLLFTDDDCLPAADWLAAMVLEFSSADAPDVIGGRVELYDSADEPITVIRSTGRKLIRSATELMLPAIIGANMAFRRTVIEDTGLFDPLLGPGTKGRSGLDIDLLYRALRHGFAVLYSPAAVVYHNHGRCSEAQVAQLVARYQFGRGALYCKYRRQMEMQRVAYWELKTHLVELSRHLLCRRQAMRRARLLWGLLHGGMTYLFYRSVGVRSQA